MQIGTRLARCFIFQKICCSETKLTRQNILFKSNLSGFVMLLGIFGTGRNGSTMLMRLLDGSPGIWIFPYELSYLRDLYPELYRVEIRQKNSELLLKIPILKRYALDKKKIFFEWSKRLFEEIESEFLPLVVGEVVNNNEAIEEFRQNIGKSIQEDFIELLEAGRKSYDRRKCETLPHLAFKSAETDELHRYVKLFPDMRFLHIIRDPWVTFSSMKRTVILSKKKPMWYGGLDQLQEFLERRWIPHARFILEILAADNPNHYLVKYEKLCEDPKRVLGDICKWLDIPLPPDPGLMTIFGGRRFRKMPKSSSQKEIENPERITIMSDKFQYRDVLTERERDFILTRAYDLILQMGYLSSGGREGLPSKMGQAMKWLTIDEWDYLNSISKWDVAKNLVKKRVYVLGKLL